MVVSMSKNLSRRYSSYYIFKMKFVEFLSIYYAINLDIDPSFIVFSNLYLGFIHLL